MTLPPVHTDEKFAETRIRESQRFKNRAYVARLYRLLYLCSVECYPEKGERPAEYSRWTLVDDLCEHLGTYRQNIMNWSYNLPPGLIRRINIIDGRRRRMAFHLGYPERFDKVMLKEAESLLAGVKDG